MTVNSTLNENEVSEGVVNWLRSRGYQARALIAGQQGIDVAAWHPATGHRWAIEAKGGTTSKRPKTWSAASEPAAYEGLSKAFLVATSWTGIRAMRDTSIGIAIPDDPEFAKWAGKVEHACLLLGIAIFHVGNEQSVTVRPPYLLEGLGSILKRSPHLAEPTGQMPASLRRNFELPPYSDD